LCRYPALVLGSAARVAKAPNEKTTGTMTSKIQAQVGISLSLLSVVRG
jgi:hypothetical protein